MKFLHILAESKLFQIVYLLLFVTSLQNIMSGQTVKQNNLTELNPDQIVKRELVGGETHKYNVEANQMNL